MNPMTGVPPPDVPAFATPIADLRSPSPVRRPARLARSAIAPVTALLQRPELVDLSSLQAPALPEFGMRTVTIADVEPTSSGDSTAAFMRAIAACADAGGGRVIVPAGRWLVGPICLRDGVELHLAEGATLRFAPDPARYLPPVPFRHVGRACLSPSPMIYANGASRVAITGLGTIEGGGASWWPWADREPALVAQLRRLPRDESTEPADATGFRPPLVGFVDCRDVLIDGVTIDGAGPACTIRLARCDRATIRGLSIRGDDGPDNHGIVVEASHDVRIERCDVESAASSALVTGDAGRAAERVVIRDLRARSLRGDGVTIGGDDVRDVHLRDVRVVDAGRHGLSVRGARGRGGIVERVCIEQLRVTRAGQAGLHVDTEPGRVPGAAADCAPRFRRLTFARIACARAAIAVFISGLPDYCAEELILHDVDARGEEGLSCVAVVGLWLRDVRVEPAFGPDLSLRDVRDVWIDGIRHDRPNATFLDLRGRRTRGIRLQSEPGATVRPSIALGVDVPRDAIVQA